MVKCKICRLGVAVVVMMAGWASIANADVTSEHFMFNVSNEFSKVFDESEAPGYGTVDISANDISGIVTFTVDAAENPDGLYGTLNNFGIQKFGFNVTDDSILSDISPANMPTGWSFSTLPSNSLSMYGVFEFVSDGTGSNRQDPLEFSLQLGNHALAVATNFVAESSSGYFFAAHVAGFANGPGSHWIGAIPAPGALTLGVFGLIGLGFSKRRLTS